MRLVVECEVRREAPIPINHQHLLAGVAYRFLACSDGDYARFLHDEGYAVDGGPKRFKLFCFSGLRARRRRVAGNTLWVGPGTVQWIVGSAVGPFLQNFATGLLAAGELSLGTQTLPITQAQARPTPEFGSGSAAFTCLTPIVAGVAMEGGGTRYLRPCEGQAFSAAVRGNLLRKYHALHGHAPDEAEAHFELTYDPDYLAAPRHREGTKLIRYKEINIVGAQAPFTASGSPALLKLMYDCGAGEKNAGGFGMVEVQEKGRRD